MLFQAINKLPRATFTNTIKTFTNNILKTPTAGKYVLPSTKSIISTDQIYETTDKIQPIEINTPI